MPDRIHLLPDSVANQIAAGEVIQRPASVIKELVENAVDAGADDIRIVIRDAGRTLIQVIDNGHGMSATDTRMAFERHATSKINSASDLSSLRTMGFRGEALPSICAVAMVDVHSRTPDSAMGTHLVISGSKVEMQEPDVCDAGTNIQVKNLFFNVPARRKFLKSDSVELSNIMREFERLALVNPAVKMSIDTGTKTIELRKGNFRQRIGEIWKGTLVQQLIPVEADTPSVKIAGYVTRPEFARRRNPLQYFLVNGRNMRHPYFKKAVLNCFTGLIAPETMPCFFIRFDIDPSAIDVNIHPTKDEIKFEEETVIWSVLTAAVKAALGKSAAVPSIDFESDAIPASPIGETGNCNLPRYDIPTDYNPFAGYAATSSKGTNRTPGKESPERRSGNPGSDWEKLYEGFMAGKIKTEPAEKIPSIPEIETPELETGDSLQYDDKYIIMPVEGKGVMIIDQYRAHLKVLYEQMMARIRADQPVSQSLLFPELIELSTSMESALGEVNDTLRKIGIIIEKEGTDYVITGVPPGVSAQSGIDIVMRVIESVADTTTNYGEESREDSEEIMARKVALATARSMAVKRGRSLSEEERKNLTSELFSLPDPTYTPNGRQIFTVLDTAAIERLLP